jgi:hypothetical protein
MTLRGILVTLVLAIGLAACQTTIGGDPSPSAIARLERAGFKPEEVKEFNDAIGKQDLVTKAVYICSETCSDFVMVAFALDPSSLTITDKDIAEFNSLSTRQKSRLWGKLNEGVDPGTFTNISGRVFRTEGGYMLRLNAQMGKKAMREAGVPGLQFYVAFSYLSAPGQNRALVSISTSRAAANRWADPSLLN